MAAVVVAEDDDRQRELVTAVLRAEGHDVLSTQDGLAAIDAIRTGTFEVAVLDVMIRELAAPVRFAKPLAGIHIGRS